MAANDGELAKRVIGGRKRHAPSSRQAEESIELTLSQSYRALAEAERLAAEQTTLPSRRDMHERSAMAWEEKARAAEDTATKASVNAIAKANGDLPQPASRYNNRLRRV